ncbi:fibroblast growth factor 4A-like [Boleophthalmus pectinirostris]|uniref:fibroblast growth factor 4A-like n=1 Tax=Boleophthalmus pectinirostris TaxID=150288 RepID=UPI00242E18A6|nr:fibroblast growth factor 4A-like [Boleophthalmus pectinirostris]
MDVFRLLLLLLCGFGARDWSSGAQKPEVKGLWGQNLREVLSRRDPAPWWSSGAPHRKLLYCRVGKGFHLQIPSGGEIRGVHSPDESCPDSENFTDECRLKETLLENHYNTYSSELYPGLHLGLSHRGDVKRGTRVTPNQPCAHFLPRRTL